jgi:hypothetical protein
MVAHAKTQTAKGSLRFFRYLICFHRNHELKLVAMKAMYYYFIATRFSAWFCSPYPRDRTLVRRGNKGI